MRVPILIEAYREEVKKNKIPVVCTERSRSAEIKNKIFLMFVRIVKLSFDEANIDSFLSNFKTVKDKIRGFEGNQLLELYRDKHNSNVFFTYSYWNDESDLENYRNSELFKGIWAKTKPLFNAKPEAWSVDKIASLK